MKKLGAESLRISKRRHRMDSEESNWSWGRSGVFYVVSYYTNLVLPYQEYLI